MTDDLERSVVALRQAFDRSFSEAPATGDGAKERLLAIRIDGHRYALRLDEIAGLASRRKIVPIPSAMPQLLGLSGNRGTILPVYDLAALMGHEGRRTETRWLVFAHGRHEDVGLSCFSLEGYLELPRSEIRPRESPSSAPARRHVHHTVRSSDGPRSVIDLSSLVAALADAAGRHSTTEK